LIRSTGLPPSLLTSSPLPVPKSQVGKDGKLTHSSEIKVFMDASTGKPGKWYKYASVYVRE
jgi:hypothetical protein